MGFRRFSRSPADGTSGRVQTIMINGVVGYGCGTDGDRRVRHRAGHPKFRVFFFFFVCLHSYFFFHSPSDPERGSAFPPAVAVDRTHRLEKINHDVARPRCARACVAAGSPYGFRRAAADGAVGGGEGCGRPSSVFRRRVYARKKQIRFIRLFMRSGRRPSISIPYNNDTRSASPRACDSARLRGAVDEESRRKMLVKTCR